MNQRPRFRREALASSIPMRTRASALLFAVAVTATACGSSSDAAGDADQDAAPENAALQDDGQEDAGEDTLSDSGLPTLAADDVADDEPADDLDEAGDGVEDLDEDEAVDAYMDCLRDEGIDPDAITEASFEDQEAMTSAPEFLEANAICEPILEAAFGDFELDPEMEAALADRSAEMAACGREVLGVEVPDDVLLLPDDDPRMIELDALETTPEQDAALEQCLEEILGDIIDEDGNLVAPEETE